MRLEILYKKQEYDGRAERLTKRMQALFPETRSLGIIDILLLNGIDSIGDEEAAELFADTVAQRVFINRPALVEGFMPDWQAALEVTCKPGVTNPLAITTVQTIETRTGVKLGPEALVQTARQYVFSFRPGAGTDPGKLKSHFYNALIENAEIITRPEWQAGRRFLTIYPHTVPPSAGKTETFRLREMSDDSLTALSKQRLLALSLEEMQAVRNYYRDGSTVRQREKDGLPADATDVELEMIAQTWSEHCKHKIFQADIAYEENGKTERISSVFKTYIKATTDELAPSRPDLCSVFTDNSGVVRFDDDTAVCFKVETHNSPSALDPYGGAITGIVGVNRDILGTGKGAKPIFNTNVLCFGRPDTDQADIPEGLLHPAQIMNGVHRGIIDGGNQSGIPTVAGAFLFDQSYLGKPLVFCGTGGILPAVIRGEDCWIKHIDPGDRAVMLGGRIGKDGIHGATFSSEALTETSPTSAVQIGDPIIQKKMTDFLLEARDLGLYKGITDNGAGGLSSSLGEMAEYSGGVRIFLHQCPLKYQGLAAWEILVSESQERMSLAVADSDLPAFMELAGRRDVEAAVVGEFTNTGFVEVIFKDELTAKLSMEFLHKGLPMMKLRAVWKDRPAAPARAAAPDEKRDWTDTLLNLLSEPNIASKESLVRQYDHEVQAHSVVKPFCGPDAQGPTDGAVLRPVHSSFRGLTITHGICQRYGDIDTYHMALCAVDEAFRAHIGLGGNPDRASALDNFCWPDPVMSAYTPDGEYKLAQLVRACRGLKDACLAYNLPLISGKDSMKNDANLGGKKVSVRPTLLVSLMGIIDDVRKAVTTDFKGEGDIIYVLGATNGETGGTMFEKMSISGDPGINDVPGGYPHLGPCPQVDLKAARSLYTTLAGWIAEYGVRSCHDCSDGGLAVTLAESAMAGGLGCETDLGGLPGSVYRGGPAGAPAAEILFCESPSRFVVSIAPGMQAAFENFFTGQPVREAGRVTGSRRVRISIHGVPAVSTGIDELLSAWQGRFA